MNHVAKKETCELLVQETSQTQKVFSKEALAFLFDLEQKFGPTRKALLETRKTRQRHYDDGEFPDFNSETAHIRENNWTIDPVPEILQDRRVEITGPVDRKMMINALNSGAKVFMGDFEDATTPTFENILNGQINVQDYASGTLEYTDIKTGKNYQVNNKPALMMIRPRGLHLEEAHLEIDGAPLSASLVDFGLHIFHTGKTLAEKGLGPFYYLPKLESHMEARLWNDIFVYAQDCLGIPQGTVKATVLIETLPAAFEMDEILYELRHHAAGLNCGRWDYIFSYIKTLRNHPEFILPNRAYVTMDKEFLKAYSVLLIKTCHKRHAHAMGGMAAQIPIKNDELANAKAIQKVRADKVREAELYHDGTWVSHPALIKPAMDVFNMSMPRANNLHRECREKMPTALDMLCPHDGNISEHGVRTNVAVALEYITAWYGGRGAVPINNLMEDAATAEICRAQLWQWLRFNCPLTADENHYVDKSRVITMTASFFKCVLQDEFEKLKCLIDDNQVQQDNLEAAKNTLEETVLSDEFQDFLTLPAYSCLTKRSV
ncbi:MAG: malate synthase A [Zetaproteobacteria bacterium]|nr:MAG: malate synthase A [Zetaproteobacteria bacterium]